MKILLFLAKGFETMEASVFIDVIGWARNDYKMDLEVITCGKTRTGSHIYLWKCLGRIRAMSGWSR